MKSSNAIPVQFRNSGNVFIINCRQAFSNLRDNWNAVYNSDDESHLFLSWDWLDQLYERRPEPVFILAFKLNPADNQFSAFLPLRKGVAFDRSNGMILNTLSLAGSHWADYAGLLCDPLCANTAVPALGKALRQCTWNRLSLDCLRISQHRLELLGKSFPKDSFHVQRVTSTDNKGKTDLSMCPGIELPDTYSEYLNTLVHSNTRQKIRRFERKLLTDNTLAIRFSTNETLDSDLDSFARLWCLRYREVKGIGVYKKATKYRTILSQGFKSDILQILVLTQQDKPVAIQANYIDRNKRQSLFYVSARDNSFTRVPAGLLLHTRSIEYAIESKFRYYDLLRGDEPYKYSLGAQNHHLLNLKIQRRVQSASSVFLDEDCIDQALQLTRDLAQRLSPARVEKQYCQMLESWPNSQKVLEHYAQWLMQSGKLHHAQIINQHLQSPEHHRSGNHIQPLL